MVGVGRGAAAGVLIKNAEALEVMERVDTLVVDKTGTLTEGKPRVMEVLALAGDGESDFRASAKKGPYFSYPHQDSAPSVLLPLRRRGLLSRTGSPRVVRRERALPRRR